MASIIKANQLQDFGGNSILTSDGAGVVTPNATGIKMTPAFKVNAGSATTLPNQTYTKVTYSSKVIDTNNCYDTSLSRFTPTVAGEYEISALARINSSSDFNDWIISIYKNGTRVQSFQGQNTHYNSRQLSAIVEFNGSSDYVEVYAYHNQGGNVDTEASAEESVFQGFKLIGV
jgi:hypothetical protein